MAHRAIVRDETLRHHRPGGQRLAQGRLQRPHRPAEAQRRVQRSRRRLQRSHGRRGEAAGRSARKRGARAARARCRPHGDLVAGPQHGRRRLVAARGRSPGPEARTDDRHLRFLAKPREPGGFRQDRSAHEGGARGRQRIRRRVPGVSRRQRALDQHDRPPPARPIRQAGAVHRHPEGHHRPQARGGPSADVARRTEPSGEEHARHGAVDRGADPPHESGTGPLPRGLRKPAPRPVEDPRSPDPQCLAGCGSVGPAGAGILALSPRGRPSGEPARPRSAPACARRDQSRSRSARAGHERGEVRSALRWHRGGSP